MDRKYASNSSSVIFTRRFVLKPVLVVLLWGILFPLPINARVGDSNMEMAVASQQDPSQETVTIKGKVKDKDGNSLPGVTVIVKGNTAQGTITNSNGEYTLNVWGGVTKPVLIFSFVGMKTQEIATKGSSTVNVVMQEDEQQIEEVVVTGMFTRKQESFTGAARTMTKDELKRVGNTNVFQSLKNLDPSLKILDNYSAGSNPNSMPDMRLRGTSSFSEDMDTSLKGNYQSDPNQPLFILDGFETTIETVFDLDMNRVQSITILKDAASKALYGSKAANGVVVIETVGLEADGIRVTYNGNLDLEMPDLTSYNLCNSLEKLQVELLEGNTYNVKNPTQMELYYSRLKKAKEGFDQYWLALPLQVGVGQKHNLTFEMGNKEFNTLFSVFYNDVQGVMKESYRRTFGGTAQITYRKKKVLFRDIATINSNNTQDSPYGTFSDYAKQNPYLAAYNEDGTPVQDGTGGTYSPLYNATTNSKSQTSYLSFTNNFYIEYKPIEDLKLTARVGLTTKRSDADEYYSNKHGNFSGSNYVFDDSFKAGSYQLNYGKSSTVSADIYANYTKTIKKHTLFANVGWSINETTYKEIINKAYGFLDASMDDFLFGTMYGEDSSPTGSASKNRNVGVTGVFAYTYDDRYLFDGTFRANGSSAFGVDKPWATFWSVGLGWNIHNEAFLKGSDFIKQLKLRGSLGYTGNQNFQTNKSAAMYKYYLEEKYNKYWVGTYLNNMRNPGLEWELKKDYNVGFDLKVKCVSLTFDWYRSDTENLVTQISLPASTGFTSVSENLGLVRNQGIEIALGINVVNTRDFYLNLNANIATNSNKLLKLSDAMRTYNEQQQALFDEYRDYGSATVQTSPVTMYYEGMHMNTIWAVPSLGIDPSDGYEVYLDKNGKMTKEWKAENMVAAGVADDKYTGNFGLNGEYKGIGLSVVFRFAGGGELYNQTLVDKVENVDIRYNVDRRVFTGRWSTPGQMSQYRRINYDYENYPLYFAALNEGNKTRPTTRFVQKNNELNLSAVSVYYDFPKKWIQHIDCERLRLQANMNDIYKWSTIGIERGTSYPFARTLSLSLSATF